MTNSEKTKWLVVSIVFLAAVLVFAYMKKNQTQVFVPPPSIEQPSNEKYAVNYIRVIQGHEFDLKLADEKKRVHAMLLVTTPPEARNRVIAHINASKSPEIIVYDRKKDGTWLVDLLFEGTSLTGWLQQQGLSWE